MAPVRLWLTTALILLAATPLRSGNYYWDHLRTGSATDALRLLKAQGYRDVKNLRREGMRYEATATHNHTVMQVLVDPFTGIIIPINASSN